MIQCWSEFKATRTLNTHRIDWQLELISPVRIGQQKLWSDSTESAAMSGTAEYFGFPSVPLTACQ